MVYALPLRVCECVRDTDDGPQSPSGSPLKFDSLDFLSKQMLAQAKRLGFFFKCQGMKREVACPVHTSVKTPEASLTGDKTCENSY